MAEEFEQGQELELVELEDIREDIPSVNPQLSHSWSKINKFETCPFQYKAIYLDKKKGEANYIMMIGSVVHEAIGDYNNHCIKKKITSDHDKWKDFAFGAIEKANLPAEYHEDVLTLTKQYADSHEVDIESVIGAEEKIAFNKDFEQVDWLAPDVWFRAILDYLQISGNIARIVDYKTGWAMKVNPFQLKIYAWVVKKLYPHVTDFQVEMDYIRHDYIDIKTMTEEDIEDVERKLMARVKHIESETKFEPRVGIQCSYCPVWYSCPSMKREDIKYKMPKTTEEAQALALELEKTSRLSTEMKKVLKEFCDNNGALEAGGRVYKFNVSTSYDFGDLYNLYTALDEIGIDLFECINIDNRKFKALMENPKVRDIAIRLGEKKVGVSFTTSKSDSKEKD